MCASRVEELDLLRSYISERNRRESELQERIEYLEKRNMYLEQRLSRTQQSQDEVINSLDRIEKESRARQLRRSVNYSPFISKS